MVETVKKSNSVGLLAKSKKLLSAAKKAGIIGALGYAGYKALEADEEKENELEQEMMNYGARY